MALLDLQGMELANNGGGHGGGTSSLSLLLCGNSSLSLTTCN
jgi:hypothetical protein